MTRRGLDRLARPRSTNGWQANGWAVRSRAAPSRAVRIRGPAGRRGGGRDGGGREGGVPSLAGTATLTRRLGALLDAGLPVIVAWRVVCDHASGGDRRTAALVLGVVEAGGPVAEGLGAAARSAGPGSGLRRPGFRRPGLRAAGIRRTGAGRAGAWNAGAGRAVAGRAVAGAGLGWLAFVWELLDGCGARPGPLLRAVADALDAEERGRLDVEVAAASARAGTRVLGAMPPVAALLGLGLGVDPLRVLVLTGAGRWCLLVGAVLWVAGVTWARRLTRMPPVPVATPDPLLVDALAGLVDAGVAPLTALGHLAENLRGAGDPRAGAWAREVARLADPFSGADPTAAGHGRGREGIAVDVGATLLLAGRAGLAPGELLRSCASTARSVADADTRRRAARLPVLLVLPLGLCLLPAALVLGVVPVVLGLVGA